MLETVRKLQIVLAPKGHLMMEFPYSVINALLNVKIVKKKPHFAHSVQMLDRCFRFAIALLENMMMVVMLHAKCALQSVSFAADLILFV